MRGSDTLDGTVLSAVRMSVRNATITLEGTIANSATITSNEGRFVVGSGGATLSGGTWSLSNNAANLIVGQAASATLTDVSATISGAGDIGDGEMTLTQDAAGVIDANAALGLILGTGANRIRNSGVIEATGSGGLSIESAVLNSGKLEAIGSTVTVAGSVSGAGSAIIGAGGAMVFDSSFSQAVSFTGTTGELVLARSQGFASTITGFATGGGTSLDLEDIAFAGASVAYSGTSTSGVLTVTSGSEVSRITLEGNYLTSTFTLSRDASGGTIVTDPAAAPIVQAIAGFAPAASVSSAPTRTDQGYRLIPSLGYFGTGAAIQHTG